MNRKIKYVIIGTISHQLLQLNIGDSIFIKFNRKNNKKNDGAKFLSVAKSLNIKVSTHKHISINQKTLETIDLLEIRKLTNNKDILIFDNRTNAILYFKSKGLKGYVNVK